MILSEVEKQLETIRTKSTKVLYGTFVLENGSWILRSEQERYNMLQNIKNEVNEFEQKHGELINNYLDAYGKEEGFIDFLNKMAKINPDHEKIISKYIYLQDKINSLDVAEETVEQQVEAPVVEEETKEQEVKDVIVPEVPVSPVVPEEPLVGEVAHAEKEVVEEKKNETPVVEAPVVEPKKEETTSKEEVAVNEPEVKEAHTFKVVEVKSNTKSAEETVEEELEEIEEVDFIKEQIADKKAEIKDNRQELKELRQAKRHAVKKRRKYNWSKKLDGLKKSINKKAVIIKGLGILETKVDRSNDYRKVYLEIEKFYLSYENRPYEENVEEISRLDQVIGASDNLTISEKMRLYRKIQRLSRKAKRLNNKTVAVENKEVVSGEALNQVLGDSQSLLDGFELNSDEGILKR